MKVAKPLCAIACAILLSIQPAAATNFTWNDSAGGLWDEPANWTGAGGPPGAGDSATFSLSSIYNVSFSLFSTPATWDLDEITATAGVVTIDGAGSPTFGANTFINLTTGAADLDVNGGHLIFQDSPNNTLSVNVGDDVFVRNGILQLDTRSSLTAPTLQLGTATGQTGELFITGGTYVDTSNISQSLGLNGGSALLTLQAGGATLSGTTRLAVSSVSGSTAFVNVSGGTLSTDTIEMGGTVVGTDGTISLTGTGTLVQAGTSSLSIGGSAGAGVINIQDDALLDTGTGGITINTTGDVNLSGGTFQADGFLDFQGGRLDMSGGELVINNGMDAIVPGGVFNFTGGTVRVEGGLARLETSLNYGGPSNSERANLLVRDGNTAQVQFAVRIGNSAGSFGRLEVNGEGSSITGTGGGAGADLLVGGAGDGQLEVTDGGFASFRDDFVVAEQSSSNGTALVRGEINGNRATVDVTIGGSNANVSVGQAGVGVLNIEDGGLVRAANDVFVGSGATANGTITVGDGPSCGGDFQLPCSAFDATLQSGDDLWLGGGSTSAGGAGELNVNAGGLVVVPDLLRVYSGGTLNLADGRIELGRLEVQSGAINFTGGELHFTGSETLDATLITAIEGVSGSHDNGLISAAGALTIDAPLVVDTNSVVNDGVTVSTLTVNALLTHDSGRVETSTLNLNATYTLNSGRLSITTGANLDTNLNFVVGGLVLNDTALNAGVGGLLGDNLSFSAGQIVDNNGVTNVTGTMEVDGGTFNAVAATNVLSGGLLRVVDGQFNGSSQVTVQNGGELQVTGGIVDIDNELVVESGGVATNASTLRPFGVNVEAGGVLTNTDALALNGGNVTQLAGTINNQGVISLFEATASVPASGLTLTGGGELIGAFSAALEGAGTGVISNMDNVLRGTDFANKLTIRNALLTMGPTAVIGPAVELDGVDLVGGSVNTIIASGGGVVFDGESTIDGVVEMTGGVSLLNTRILPTGDVRLQPISQLTLSPSVSDVDGRIRAEQGAIVNLPVAGIYNWTDATLSLADDSTHTINPGATLILTNPIEFDNLTVIEDSTGFVGLLYGVEPVISAGQALQVDGVTTLDHRLTVDGGAFTTGSLISIENLDLRAGEFRLTADDFVVSPANTGTTFSVGSGATLTVDETIDVAAASRLAVVGGTVNAQGASGTSLTNSGDLDLIDAVATFDAPATNDGDLNAIDSDLTFINGLTSTGQVNLINSNVSGPVTLNGTVAVAGTVSFSDDVDGAANFTGSGEVTFLGGYAPGASPAAISFAGDLALGSAATLEMELGGATPGSQYDSLIIAGDVLLDGTLQVNFINGFENLVAAGDQFTLIDASTIAGSPSNMELPALASDLVWQVQQSGSALVLAVGLAGDFNNDGLVNIADYTVWRDNLGAGGESAINFAGDGLAGVDVGDYVVWKNNFGSSSTSAFQTSSIPEPTGFFLIAIGLIYASIGRTVTSQISTTGRRGPRGKRSTLRTS